MDGVGRQLPFTPHELTVAVQGIIVAQKGKTGSQVQLTGPDHSVQGLHVVRTAVDADAQVLTPLRAVFYREFE